MGLWSKVPELVPGTTNWATASQPRFGHMLRKFLLSTSVICLAVSGFAQQEYQQVLTAHVRDTCAEIAGRKWVLPSEARACMSAFPVDPVIKSNVSPLIGSYYLHSNVAPSFQLIEVVNKTLAFHTSVNFQIQAPPPYDRDVHEDLLADLARINQTEYASEFDLHLDFYRSFKKVNDGHCGVYNYCYDGELKANFLPFRANSSL